MSGSCCPDASQGAVGQDKQQTQPVEPGACCAGSEAQSCAPPDRQSGHAAILPIVWQRLVIAGETCPRCDATSQNVLSAVATLRAALKPLNIEPTLEFREIGESDFKSDPAQSNRIWIGGKPLEEWVNANVGGSRCCAACGDEFCRTVEVDGIVFEEVPEAIIVKAGLAAASAMIG